MDVRLMLLSDTLTIGFTGAELITSGFGGADKLAFDSVRRVSCDT